MTTNEARKKNRKKLEQAEKFSRADDRSGAEKIWRAHLKDAPEDADVLFNVGVCIQRRAVDSAERHESATFFNRVVSSPEATMERKADSLNNLGLLMESIGESEKAMVAYGFALKMWPDHRAARVNLGDSHRHFGNFHQADEEFRVVLSQDEASPEAHFCAGMIALLLGDYKRGWEEYRWRVQVPNYQTKPFITDKPKWQGEPLDAKTIILTEEQGFGDSFQFLRYARWFKSQGARVVFRAQPALHRIAEGFDGIDEICHLDHEPAFDFHLPLMDAPHYAETTLATIPTAHCLRVMPRWERFSLQTSNLLRKRIAIVWAGSPAHGKDKARSIPAEAFQQIIDANPSHDFYSLQAGPKQPEIQKLSGLKGDLSQSIKDWTTTAQILSCIDLLISVDTACVHLAGALGRPVWMLTPYSPDWRWLLARTDSPWYPRIRLFRQPAIDDWQTPLTQISNALQAL